MKFNTNHKVRVKLTDRGRAILLQAHEELNKQWPEVFKDYTPQKEDAEGWSEWQLWCLMKDLGGHCVMGPEPPFETEIELCI